MAKEGYVWMCFTNPTVSSDNITDNADQGFHMLKVYTQTAAQITDKKYNIIKKIVASIQTLVNKGIIKTNNHIIQNLRKYYCPKKFLILLSSIKLLNENTDFCKIKNKYYENYLNFLSEQINL